MPLPSSGSISLNQIHIEAGGSSGSQASLNDADIRAMIGKSSGASNAFSEYRGVSASQPSVSYRGRTATTGNGFPQGYVSLSSGTKVVVVCLQLGGGSSTYCNLGSTSLTLASKMGTLAPVSGIWGGVWTSAIYYTQTSASGSVYISGNGGSGRSCATVYEITGYNSSTPYTTDTAQNTNLSYAAGITVASQYNGMTIGSAISEDSYSQSGVTVTNADSIEQIHLESASAHTSWYDAGTPTGNRTYTVTLTNPGPTQVSGVSTIQLATASWK